MRVVAVSPGWISAAGGSKRYVSSLSASLASKATNTGALALFLTRTSKFALRRPDDRSGLTLVSCSVNGWMPSAIGSAAAVRSWALECATTSSSQIRASASATRGGWKWISISCS
jgi:hypothetical protein